jgi:hypothetical protein
MSMKAVGSRFLYEALFNGGYLVAISYWVMYYGDKVLGHSSGSRHVHILVDGTSREGHSNM